MSQRSAAIDWGVGGAGHGGHDHRDLVAGRALALDVARDVADAVDVGDRGSAELHDEASHAGLISGGSRGGNSGRAGEPALAQAPARKGGYTYRCEFVPATAPLRRVR